MQPSSTDTHYDYESALRACAAGDRGALESLYRQEGARLVGVARRIVGDTALAEDIVHDAFVNIWRRASSFDASRGAARGWVYSITRHLALNHVRDHGRTSLVDEATVEALATEGAMEAWRDRLAGDDWQAEAARVGPCLERLEPERRRCILHAYVDGLSHAEIAERLSTPLGTIKSWITRSLKALRECLA